MHRLAEAPRTRTQEHFAGCGLRAGQGAGQSFAAADFSGANRTGSEFGERVFALDAEKISEKNGCRYKRIRKRLKGKPNEEVYRLKKEVLGRFEQLSVEGWLDLYYGDEAGVNLEPNVPYGWQFRDEEVSMPSSQGKGINCFGLFTRDNRGWAAVSEATVSGAFVAEQLERFSFSLKKLTIVVLDNARIHRGNRMRERIEAWQRRGLYIFYLPTYSPHLNIAETVWRKLKYEWLSAEDYTSKEHLQYAVKQALWAFGKSLKIKFSNFKIN